MDGMGANVLALALRVLVIPITFLPFQNHKPRPLLDESASEQLGPPSIDITFDFRTDTPPGKDPHDFQ